MVFSEEATSQAQGKSNEYIAAHSTNSKIGPLESSSHLLRIAEGLSPDELFNEHIKGLDQKNLRWSA